MLKHICMIGSGLVLVASAQVEAAGWALQAASGPLSLTFNSGEAVSYRFECAPTEIIITETGVTELLDLKTGNRIADGADAKMPPGAAMMALYSGNGTPQLIPAQFAKNPAGGWDLTIRLPKNDRQLKAMGHSQMMSLFTTGYTMGVKMDEDARAKWNDFMQRCNVAA
jgi:hypothetical protein